MHEKFKTSGKNVLGYCRSNGVRPCKKCVRRNRIAKHQRSKQRRKEGWDELASLLVSAVFADPELVKRGVKLR